MRRALGVVCIVIALGVAGCSGAPGSQSPSGAAPPGDASSNVTAAPSVASNVSVDGDLPVNAPTVYGRVLELTDDRVRAVTVYPKPTLDDRGLGAPENESFAAVMGLEPSGNAAGPTLKGYTPASRDRVFVATTPNASTVESVLAHEYVHVLQLNHDAYVSMYRTVAERTAATAVSEGTAVLVQDAYEAEIQDDPRTTPAAARRTYRALPASEKFVRFPYLVGYAYVANHTAGVDDHAGVYESPPRTTEELIHDLEPGSEPPMALSLAVDGGDGGWTEDERTLGEHFVRVALDAELDWNRSARAGTGWGADRALTVNRPNDTAYVWATRWDTTTDADEFDAAMRAALDSRANRTGDDVWLDDGDAFRLVHASDDVVVLVAGDSGYVANATVTATGSNVTVTPAMNATAA